MMTSPVFRFTTVLTLGCVLFGGVLGCTTSRVTVTANKDATLYQDAAGALADGGGQHMFAGSKGGGQLMHALVAFDVAGKVPAGKRLTAVRLRLNLSRASSDSAQAIALHRVLADWGEGTTVAPGGEGGGGPASIGGATWLHTFFSNQLWSHPGGDFDAASSASSDVAGMGAYEWASAAMVADVQKWLDDPSSNHGWLLTGSDNATVVKRFDTRENGTAANRPALTLIFTSRRSAR